MRDESSAAGVGIQMPKCGLHALSRSKIALLTTYKRDGTAVSTPVSVVVDGDAAYIRTYSHTGKAKRLRRNNAVLAAPATFRGKPLGPAIRCTAELLHGDAAAGASRKISRHSPFLEGLAIPLTARLRKYTMLHYAVTGSALDQSGTGNSMPGK